MMIALSMMNPWFAVAGLAAISLPLWMHLYQRVASRRVPISSLRLVPEAPRVARSRRWIRNWPLFLLRVLGVFLLGLAFARPSSPQGGQSPEGGREVVVFVLDRSGSMAMRSPAGRSAWEEAQKLVQDRLAGLHPQSRVRLVCYPPVAMEDEWASPSAMAKVVADLRPSLAAARPLEALREAAEAMARFRSDMPATLEVIGDLQTQGWNDIDTLTLPEELRVQVRQVGDPGAENRGLSLSVRGSDQLRRGAVVTQGGSSPLLVRDMDEAGRTEAEEEFSNPDEVLELPYRAAANGWTRREAAFVQNSDGLLEDDRLFDAFFMAPKIPVYLLEPHPERETFLQTTFFLNQALRPTAGEASEDSRFLPEVVPVNNAVEVLRGLQGGDAVVVVPPLASWSAELPAAIEAFARQGGGVVFFSGPDLDPQAYAESWQSLLPALPGTILAMDRHLVLPPISETHPIWGGLSTELRRKLRRVPLPKRLELTVAEGTEVTARYADEVPLVVRKSVGSGRSLFINTSADRAWGDWPAVGSLYVPTVHMLMSSALTSTPQMLRNSPGSGVVGVPFDVRVDPTWAGASLQTDNRGLPAADEEGWVRGLTFDRPGHFDILANDGRVVRPVAVNFPPDESRREFSLPAIVQRQLEARRRVAGSDGAPARISLASESGWWRWILVALAVVWLAEPWLALRSRRRAVQKEVQL